MYVYIDESGTLNLKQGDYFIVAALVTNEKHTAGRCLKKIRENHLKKEYKKLSELKYHNSSPEIIRRILQCISKQNITVYYTVYEIRPYSRNNLETKIEIFGTLLKRIISDNEENADVYIDRFLNGSHQNEFNKRVIETAGTCNISHVDSIQCPGIQIADFIAGTLNKYYNKPDTCGINEYYRIIQNITIKIM